MSLAGYFDDSARILKSAAREWTEERISSAISAISRVLRGGRTLLICGNGGSAADAMHITGELVGRFLIERRALRAICLSSNPAVLTAWANDHSYDSVFARQVEAYGEAGGAIIGLSTSGNSQNVVRAFEQAKLLGMTTIALTGQGGGQLGPLSDHLFAVPCDSTPHIQQVHICLYHYLCQEIEKDLVERNSLAY